MRTIVIVDDERIIADGLLQIIENHFVDELDAVNAYSAKQALEIFKSRRVDILLTDIQMPDQSGMELMKAVKERWSWCQVIFLTGYMVFDHVYAANQGNIRYLLKSEGFDKIIDTIQESIDSLTHHELTSKTIERAGYLEKENLALQRDRILGEVINGDRVMTAYEMKQYRDYGFKLKFEAQTGLMMFRIDPPRHDIHKGITQRYMAYLRSLVEEHLEGILSFEAHEDRFGNLIIVYQQLSDDTRENYEFHVIGILEVIQEQVRQNLSFTVSIIKGADSFRFTDLHYNYLDMHYCFNYTNSGGIEKVIHHRFSAKDVNQSFRSTVSIQTTAYLYQLEQHLGLGDRLAFIDSLHEIYKLHESEKSTGYGMLRAYYRISLMLIDQIGDSESGEIMAIGLLSEMRRAASWSEVKRFLDKLTERVFEQVEGNFSKDARSVVEQVTEQVVKNLGDPSEITLTKLAERVFLSPAYLSRLFHTETGLKLSEYISLQRIESAKHLLSDPNKRIHDVAADLGFDIPSNFTRFFKKHNGMTPHEYQKNVNGQFNR